MATFSLTLPEGLDERRRALFATKSYLAGTDGNPVPTQRELNDSLLSLRQHGDESVRAVTPLWLGDRGMIASSTATLMARGEPYPLGKELVRGKLNQIRGMVADWEARGLEISTRVRDSIQAAGRSFGRIVALDEGNPKSNELGTAALEEAFLAARELVACYCEKLLAAKLRQAPRLPTIQSFYLRRRLPDAGQESDLLKAFNAVQVAVPWQLVEPEPGRFDWARMDELVEWGRSRGLRVGLGPVVDLNSNDIPGWFIPFAGDINRAASVIFRYIDQVVARFRGRVDSLLVLQGGNCIDEKLGDLDETEWLRLTFNACLRVRQAWPEIPLGVGIVQPWGELLADEHRDHNPFLFAEALSRSVDGLGSIDMELALGQGGRGSVARDLLELSRMLEQFAYMGTPLRLDFAPPALDAVNGPTPSGRIAWVREFFQLALASPLVAEVRWSETFEGERSLFPGAGLFGETGDASRQSGEIIEILADLKSRYLR